MTSHCRPVARPGDHADDVEAARVYVGPCTDDGHCACGCWPCAEAVAEFWHGVHEQRAIDAHEERLTRRG